MSTGGAGDAGSSGGPAGPSVVAIGGGHGLAATLRAVRRLPVEVTAVVSVADAGGSSGRLRADVDQPAPGDLRKCLVALAGRPSALTRAMEHRYGSGELEGHCFGNLLLATMVESEGDLLAALDEVSALLGTVRRVVPVTTRCVELVATLEAGRDVLGGSRGRPCVRTNAGTPACNPGSHSHRPRLRPRRCPQPRAPPPRQAQTTGKPYSARAHR